MAQWKANFRSQKEQQSPVDCELQFAERSNKARWNANLSSLKKVRQPYKYGCPQSIVLIKKYIKLKVHESQNMVEVTKPMEFELQLAEITNA